MKKVKTCQVKTNSDSGWVQCGQPATKHATMRPAYDLDVCDQHAALFQNDMGWTFTNVTP